MLTDALSLERLATLKGSRPSADTAKKKRKREAEDDKEKKYIL